MPAGPRVGLGIWVRRDVLVGRTIWVTVSVCTWDIAKAVGVAPGLPDNRNVTVQQGHKKRKVNMPTRIVRPSVPCFCQSLAAPCQMAQATFLIFSEVIICALAILHSDPAPALPRAQVPYQDAVHQHCGASRIPHRTQAPQALAVSKPFTQRHQ